MLQWLKSETVNKLFPLLLNQSKALNNKVSKKPVEARSIFILSPLILYEQQCFTE